MSIQQLTGDQVEEFRRIFNLFDTNGSGSLTREEIQEAIEVLGHRISAEDAASLLGRIGGRGTVTPEVFIEWMAGRKDLDMRSDLQQVFDLIDVDGSGTISVEEFTEVVRCFNSSAGGDEIARAVRRADTNGDGVVQLSEFLSFPELWSEMRLTIGALRSFKKILIQYAKVASARSVALIEVDSEIGAGTRGASMGIAALKTAALKKQAARMRSENGILSLDPLHVQTENNALFRTQKHAHAKYIDRLSAVLARSCDAVAETLTRGVFPIVLGGDHSTAAGTIAGIKKAFPGRRLGIVWIDAHADIHSPFTTPSGNMHGMPVALASCTDNLEKRVNAPDEETLQYWERCKAIGIGGPKMSLHDLVYVSVRDTESAEDYLIETVPILNYTTAAVREIGPEAVARRCLDKLAGVDLIYVSFDVDSMDSAISMGTGTPVPNGITVEEARILNEVLCRDPRVCCWEMCEINPVLDKLNTMAENSLGIFEAVVDAISARIKGTALS